MKLDLSRLTDLELALLIRNASDELADRLDGTPLQKRVAGAARPVVTVHEPSAEEKEYALRIKTILQEGQYVNASERAQVAQIAEKYPEWVRLQGLPTEKGTGAWRQAQLRHGRYKPAKER